MVFRLVLSFMQPTFGRSFSIRTFYIAAWGYWRQRAGERLGDRLTRYNQEPLVGKDKDGRVDTQEYLLVVHCFCLCRAGALFGSPWGEQLRGR